MKILNFHIRLLPYNARVESPLGLRVYDGGLKEAGSTRADRVAIRSLRMACAVLFSVLMPSLWCHSADLVFVRLAGGSLTQQQELEIAASFYGLDLQVVTVTAKDHDHVLRRAVERNDTLAAVVAADALALVNEKALLRALSRKSGVSVPLLILGVTPETDPTLLRAWSGGAAVGCKRLKSLSRPRYVVDRVAGVTRQLADLELPFPGKDTSYFVLAENGKGRIITEVRDENQVLPVFIQTALDQHKVFLGSKTPFPNDADDEGDAERVLNAFATVAPAMMFIKYCAGERGWHALYHYANLTIDDPWLREPYGHLSYKGLLGEMDRHNFHTTIAFIPWNYDRSEPEVASLVRGHPERFSICIHGDNHDHKEFSDFQTKSLPVQIAALRESLSRMDRFQTLTGISYDKVMVFPHNIGSERILEALKTYNFLATVNSENVPFDIFRRPAFALALRSVILSWGDFPSITRYPAGALNPTVLIAMNEFLDNPLLFYGHHDFFVTGISAFDAVADQVNKSDPDIRWRSLGEIVRHLYLVRLRDDSDYDVLAFSSSLSLDNVSGHDSIFYVRKQETNSPVISSVSVDGQPYNYRLHHGYLEFSIGIPAGKTRNVVVLYENDLGLIPASATKHSLRVYLLRRISDFRDITMSRFTVGRGITRLYYLYIFPLPTTLVIIGGFALILACGCGGWGLRVILTRRNRSNRAQTVPPGRSNRQDDGQPLHPLVDRRDA
jgi:hypothetical protein